MDNISYINPAKQAVVYSERKNHFDRPRQETGRGHALKVECIP